MTDVQPFPDYVGASRHIAAWQALDTDEVNPVSRTIFLTHGHKTRRAILLLHGYTNSPRQFLELAQAFHQRGYNVLVPRFPHHGMLDRMTTALEHQTEDELLTTVNHMVDLMHGLGEQVVVAGLSMGGVLALWVAQHRADVTLACSMSPAMAFHAIPLALTPLVIRAFLLLPNRFMWWDPQAKDAPLPPLHAYPRYATHGLAAIANIGLKLRALSHGQKPQAESVVLVLNPTDESVDNSYAHEIFANWKKLDAANVHLYEFDPALNLVHDLISVDQPAQKVDVVYPILLDLIDKQGMNLS